MTAMYSAILSLGHMEEELSTACRAAADALEILSNLQPGFTRNVIPRINSSTAVSVSQANSGEHQVNDEELQANESAVQSSTSPPSSSSTQARLVTLFPTVGSNRASRKDTSRRPSKVKSNPYVPLNSKTAHPPHRAIPGHLTRVKLRTAGNLT